MKSVRWLILALVVAVLALLGAAWNALRERPGIQPSPQMHERATAELVSGTQVESPAEDAKDEPHVRTAMPVGAPDAVGMVFYPIEVEVHGDLPQFEPEGRGFLFGAVDRPSGQGGQVVVDLTTSSGFSGAVVRILFDPADRTARIRAHEFVDFGPPFELGWSDVRGRVRITSWDLDLDTRIDVDVQGRRVGRDGAPGQGPERSLHLCARLPYDDFFVPVKVVLDPLLVVHESDDEAACTSGDWSRWSSGLVILRIGVCDSAGFSGAEVKLDTRSRTARVRPGIKSESDWSARYWETVQGEVRLSDWDLEPSRTRLAVDLRGEFDGRSMHFERSSYLFDSPPAARRR